MILVNDPGSWETIYPPLRHAIWNGCTPTDRIFLNTSPPDELFLNFLDHIKAYLLRVIIDVFIWLGLMWLLYKK